MGSLGKIFLFVLLLLQTVPVEAKTPGSIHVGLRDVVDTVEKSYLSLNTVTADFFQRSTISAKNREMRAEGQLFLKAATEGQPLKFRFDYFRPTTQEIISNGRTMWMYLPESNKVILSDVSFIFDTSRFNPDRASNFLQGLGRISKDFLITFPSQQQDIEGNYILELTPRRATATIEKLFILVNRDAVVLYVQNNRDITKIINDPMRQDLSFPILSTTVVDHQQNTTIMEFSNIKANVLLSDTFFDFTIPAGVDVVKPPR